MVKKITDSIKSKLSIWFAKEPAKFSVLSFGLILGVSFLYVLTKGIFGNNFMMSYAVLLLLILSALTFSIYKLIKWLPSENLERRSFVAIDNGLNFIYLGIFALFTFMVIGNLQEIMFYQTTLQHQSMILFMFGAMLVSLFYLYFVGLLVTNIYATYRRAITMGVPKWKILASLPFTFSMFRVSGYLLPEDKKEKPAILIKSKWYSNFTDWVISKPINSLIVFLFTVIISGLFFESYFTLLVILFVVIFGVWLLFTGAKKLRKSIGGSFSTFVAVFNIVIILAFIGFLTFSVNTQPASIQNETIQVMEKTNK